LKSFVDYSLIVSATATSNDIKTVLASKLKRDASKIRLLCIFHNRIAKVFQNDEIPTLEECKFLVAEENDVFDVVNQAQSNSEKKKEFNSNGNQNQNQDVEMKDEEEKEKEKKQKSRKSTKNDVKMSDVSNNVIVVEVVSVLKNSLSEFIGHPFLFAINEVNRNSLLMYFILFCFQFFFLE